MLLLLATVFTGLGYTTARGLFLEWQKRNDAGKPCVFDKSIAAAERLLAEASVANAAHDHTGAVAKLDQVGPLDDALEPYQQQIGSDGTVYLDGGDGSYDRWLFENRRGNPEELAEASDAGMHYVRSLISGQRLYCDAHWARVSSR